MAATKVMPCKCVHEFQDKTYGKGMRLFNLSEVAKVKKAKCTVCGNEKKDF